ncbi:hypothetical protein V6N11_054685 [Hibiscus sabdariffa]|uniref:Uncharacterized protein n=1 Tax=Hibiscus sabdariffa TaxID=183260 RepID=A0ABR2S527_9ROSI
MQIFPSKIRSKESKDDEIPTSCHSLPEDAVPFPRLLIIEAFKPPCMGATRANHDGGHSNPPRNQKPHNCPSLAYRGAPLAWILEELLRLSKVGMEEETRVS